MAFPPDRFDDVPEYTDQRGAHRESFAAPAVAGSTAAAGASRPMRPLLILAGLVLLAGLFLGVVLPWLTGGRDRPEAAPAATSTTAAPASPSSAAPSSPSTSAAPTTTEAAPASSSADDQAAEASRAAAESERAAQESASEQAAEASRQAQSSQEAAAAQAAEQSRAAEASRAAAESQRAAQAAEASRSAAASRSAEASRSAAASRSAEASRAAAAARSTHVTVFNATRTQGLAATYAKRLRNNGFTSVSAANWPGSGVKGSSVLYNGSENRAAAEAVGVQLGLPVVERPNLQVKGVAVVVFK